MLIDKAEIEGVKQRTSLVELIGSRGIKLVRKGKQYVGLCPFHNDHEPSLIVDAQKQLWNCLGACQEGGDVYRFVMKLDGIDFREAHRRLGGSETNPASDGHSVAETEQSSRVESEKALVRYFDYYRKVFTETPAAQEYLMGRGISREAITVFEIGYVDGSVQEKLSVKDRQALERLGVIGKSTRELFAGCVIFPLVDSKSGQVVSLYGRHIEKRQHLYMPGKRRGIFNPFGSWDTGRIVLTESIIDALVLWSAGIKKVMPIYGTNGLTDEIIGYLRECRIREAILVLDSDEAGRAASQSISEELAKHNIKTQIVELPAKDPSEFIVSGRSAEELRLLIEGEKEESIRTDKEESLSVEKNGDGSINILIEGRQYSIRGLMPTGLDRMKVNLKVRRGASWHIDSLDLYQASARSRFAQKAAHQIGVSEQKVERDLVEMIERLEAIRLEMRSAENGDTKTINNPMTAEQQTEALSYLRSPGLVQRIVEDIKACGLIGERATVLVGYLSTLSRKLSKPLSVLVVARTGAGKSSLQEALCSFVPPEDVVWVTRLTGQALFYKDPNSLKSKVLAIAEEEGAAQAIYSLRTLASEQRLSIAVTQTNPQTGELHTKHYEIQGPVSIITTTTSAEAFDEETRSRFVLLTMDESREQTQAILERQRRSRTIEGVLEEAAAEQIRQLHHNVQRMIRPLKVVNPYVEHLTYPAQRLISRREQNKYLTLIDSIALLHQHQREIKRAARGSTEVEYVEVELDDIALANELAGSVLWRSFDEIAPPVRGMLLELQHLYQSRAAELGTEAHEVALSRREIREQTSWTDWQVRVYCQKLVDMEYLSMSASGNGKPSLYKLLQPLSQCRPGLSGLTDVEQLKKQLRKQLKKKAQA